MEKKVLFFDYDGTLVSNHSGEIPDSAKHILRKLKEAGHYIFLNTGRTKAILDPIIQELNFDGMILGCGSYVEYHDDIIYKVNISEDLHIDIVRMIDKNEIDAFFEGSRHLYKTNEIYSERLLRLLRRYSNANVSIKSIHTENLDFEKLFVCYRNLERQKNFTAFISEHFDFIDRGRNCAEFVKKGHSKATGIKKILDLLGMEKKDCYVFGDSNNDLSMFEYIHNSVLIGGENPELKKYVKYISDDVDHDGLANAIYELNIIN